MQIINKMKNSLLKYKSVFIETYNSNLYPIHIQKFDKKIRFFKILGNISIFLTVGKFSVILNLNSFIIIILSFISIIYSIYRVILFIYATIELCKFIKNKEFIVKNSLSDEVSTIIKLFTKILKYIGQATIGAGSTYILASELDNQLIKNGKNPYFIPKFRQVLDKTGLSNLIYKALDLVGVTDSHIKQNDYKLIRERIKIANTLVRKTFEAQFNIPYDYLLKSAEIIEKENLSIKLTEKIDKDDSVNTK